MKMYSYIHIRVLLHCYASFSERVHGVIFGELYSKDVKQMTSPLDSGFK